MMVLCAVFLVSIISNSSQNRKREYVLKDRNPVQNSMVWLVSVYSRIVPILGNLSFDLKAQLRYNISCKLYRNRLIRTIFRERCFLTMYKILELNPQLVPFAGDIDLRMFLYRATKGRLLSEGQTLNDFANAHNYYGFHSR